MPTLSVVRRLSLAQAAACVALAGPLGGALAAQQAPVTAATTPAPAGEPKLNLDLHAALHPLADLSAAPGVSNSSSSIDDGGAATTAVSFAGSAVDPGGQPPPYRRRRYGRPSYNDRWHNADGSNRIAVVAGGGFNVPVGSESSNFLKTSWRVEGGVGINFSSKLAAIFQFDYDKFGLPGRVLTNQRNLYNSFGYVDSNDDPVDFSGLDGNAHIWSFTFNPTLTFYQSDKIGAYAVVGGGFYHKVTNFTLPTIGVGYDYYYGPYEYTTNQNFDTYTSNAPGVTGGVGVTYKFSRFANQKFFAEVRYVHTFNQVRYGDPAYLGTTTGTPYNYYPPNSNETSYLPITVGIRF